MSTEAVADQARVVSQLPLLSDSHDRRRCDFEPTGRSSLIQEPRFPDAWNT